MKNKSTDQNSLENRTGKVPVNAIVSCFPIKVNHGNVFGTGSWYTFFCPRCKAQITRAETEEKACECGLVIDWS